MTPSVLGLGWFGGTLNVNVCMRIVKKRNSSILAKFSPIQDLLPEII
jgi:hypothetical protein